MLAKLGAEAYAQELERHRLELRAAFVRRGGSVVDSQGDAVFVAFPPATRACQAALEGQAALARVRMRVRMGIDTGEPLATGAGNGGMTVHRGGAGWRRPVTAARSLSRRRPEHLSATTSSSANLASTA